MSVQDARAFGRNLKVADRHRAISADTTLNPQDKTVVVDSSSNTVRVTLPYVSVARGQTITIHCPNANIQDVTIEDQNDSYSWSDITVNGANESHMLVSDGSKWTVSPITIT